MTDRDQLLDEIREIAKRSREADRDAAVIELLHIYLKHRPDDGFMWYTFGDSLRIIGLKDEAERALNTALALCPEKRAWILTRLARLYDDAGRHAEAEAAYAEACTDSEFGTFGWLWIMRGGNLAAATQLTAAEKCHRHALTFNDEHVSRDEAFLNLGNVLRAMGRYNEAADAYQSALEITPDYTECLEALDSLEDIEAAIQTAKELSKYGDPTPPT